MQLHPKRGGNYKNFYKQALKKAALLKNGYLTKKLPLSESFTLYFIAIKLQLPVCL